MMQIDNAVLKISTVLRKASNIKNRFAPINQIPPEILALAVTFLTKQRDVINTTAVCQQWRATLLCFPQVWRKAGGLSSELEAYLERSKSIPIEVDLFSPGLVTSIVPHASRLEKLAVSVEDLAGLEQITRHLCDPIPTLRSFEFLNQNPQLLTIEFPSCVAEGLFQHLKTLRLCGSSSFRFRGSQCFLHITELILCTGRSPFRPVADLVDTLGQLPGLVKVSLIFRADWYADVHLPKTITLSCLNEIHLLTPDITGPTTGGAIPLILQSLKLPAATKVLVQSPFPPWATIPVLPDAPFSEHLPNYVDLPWLEIETKNGSGEVSFMSASQALFTYHTGRLEDHQRELKLWGGLPISSIRTVIAIQLDLIHGEEDVWLAGLIGELEFLELLELGGDCGHVLRQLRHRMVRGVISVGINTLVVRGGEYARSQALKFDAVRGEVVGTTVTYILDPAAQERYLEFESSSEDDSDGDYLGEGDESEDDDDDDDENGEDGEGEEDSEGDDDDG